MLPEADDSRLLESYARNHQFLSANLSEHSLSPVRGSLLKSQSFECPAPHIHLPRRNQHLTLARQTLAAGLATSPGSHAASQLPLPIARHFPAKLQDSIRVSKEA